ncbi:MAG: beta-propeller fold lactonase family protein [Bryobacteraceae bacterium]|nr:beta-propeller fold lactonase family protein [Bryobacteraceae bacterium]MDW8380188.1 alkaline phosphatase family protein [Bryobacterales bacterium]
MSRLAVFTAVSICVVWLFCHSLPSQPAGANRPGPLSKGGFLLVSGWRLMPAGKQTPVDTFPMASALSPDGQYLLVLNGGYNPASISVLEVRTGLELSRTPLEDAWLGVTFSPDGKKVYVGGGSTATVFEFDFDQGKLNRARSFVVAAPEKREHTDFLGDVRLSPDGRLIYAALLYRDQIVVLNPQSGRVIERFKTGRRPYRILFHPDGQSFFVSSWADGSVFHHKTTDGSILQRVRLAPHTTDLAYSRRKPLVPEGAEAPSYEHRLFVTAGNTNRVYVIGVSESKDLRLVESINLAFSPRQPLGMTPSALALNRDETQLYVACSDANAVAVVDVSEARSQVLGFIPTGWYPTDVRALPSDRLAILNGRGAGSGPNPRGPRPDRKPPVGQWGERLDEYVAAIQRGTVSWIDPFTEEQLGQWTQTVLDNTPYRDSLLEDARTTAGNPVPPRPGAPSPIEHVIYILKENRSYDQVLGALGKGNGDPALTVFGEEVAPNHYKLAREFVLLDNFYASGDVGADGQNWSVAAIAPDYVQRLWPNSYAGRRQHQDYEGGDPAASPPAGYLWTNAAAAGLSLRNYGFLVNLRKLPTSDGIHVDSVRDPILAPVTNRKYRGFDLDYPDAERAKVFLEDLALFEKEGKMPRLLLLRLGNDHTSGLTPGKISPRSAMADNDYALGLIVEAVSKSRFWAKTAIFVLEDDAQNGADHVDSHRTPAYVLSPYTRRGTVDSTFYNTTSMLRTIELILGLNPMTHFDAGARPMFAAFSDKADLTPYVAEKPRISLDDRNPANPQAKFRDVPAGFFSAFRSAGQQASARPGARSASDLFVQLRSGLAP